MNDINSKGEKLFNGGAGGGSGAGFNAGAGLNTGTGSLKGGGLGMANTGETGTGKSNTGTRSGFKMNAGLGLNAKGGKDAHFLRGLEAGSSFKKELAKMQEIGYEMPVDIEKINTARIGREDAIFYLNVVEKTPMNLSEVTNPQKSEGVSKTLLDLLKTANDTKKPVRIDFDNKITLILRVEPDGKISAQFFPGDKAAEEYLRNNIGYLRDQFDYKDIKYSNINYHNQREKQQQQKEKQDDE